MLLLARSSRYRAILSRCRTGRIEHLLLGNLRYPTQTTTSDYEKFDDKLGVCKR